MTSDGSHVRGDGRRRGTAGRRVSAFPLPSSRRRVSASYAWNQPKSRSEFDDELRSLLRVHVSTVCACKRMARLFGTDGVRGKAGEHAAAIARPSVDSAPRWRRATALRRSAFCPAATRANRVRGSSVSWRLASRARAASLTGAGIIPTPAIAYLTPRMGYTAGVVISASHNPFEDNGIKVFSGAGEKFTEAARAARRVDHGGPARGQRAVRRAPRRSNRSTTGANTSRICARSCPNADALRGMRIVVDCANGATTTIAPRLFQELGFEVRCIGCEPDGRNINLRLRVDGAGAARARGGRRRLSARHRV